jgi:transcriptional regulator with XRE-family HTH domain
MKNIFFSKNLAFLRKAKGVNQKIIGDLVGKKISAVSGWEIGQSQPSINDLVAIADYFNIPPGDLISIDLEEKSSGSPEYLKIILERLNNQSNNVEVIQTLRDVSKLLEELSIKIEDTSIKIWNSAMALEEKAGIEAPKDDDIF